MNIDYKKVFIALIASVLIAIPTAAALNNKSNQLNIERTKANQLNVDLKKRDSDLRKMQDLIKTKDDQLKQKTESEIQLKKQNDQLQKDLQAKAERKAEEARIAAANAQKQAAAAVSAPRAASVGTSGNCESYRGIVAQYFPASQVNNALLTMQKESGCRTNAVSPTDDHGLMQVNCRYHCSKVGGNVNALYDPETNIRLASAIYNDRGNWSAWYAVRGILW